MARTKSAANQAGDATCGQPENQQENPGRHGEGYNEKAAEIEPQDILEEHHRKPAIEALAGGIAEDDARVAGFEFVINLEPHADRHPGQHRPAKQQRYALASQMEGMLQAQDAACLVSRGECQQDQDNVR